MSDLLKRLDTILTRQNENRAEIDNLTGKVEDLAKYVSEVEVKAVSGLVRDKAGHDGAEAAGYWLKGLAEQKRTNFAQAEDCFDHAAAIMGVSKATMNESSDANGGVIVPVPIQAVIHEVQQKTGVLRAAGAKVVQMAADTLVLPKLATRIGFGTYNELATINQTDATLGSVTCTARVQAGMTAASNQVLADGIVALGSWFVSQAALGMNRLEDSIVFSAGDGAYFTALPDDSNITNVTAAAYGFDLLGTLLFESLDPSVQEQAVVVGAPKSYRVLVNKTDSAGNYVYSPSAGSPAKSVWGRPFLTTDVISAAATSKLVAGDFGSAVVIGERQPLSVLADSYSLANTLATRFVFSRRVGYATVLPGALVRSTNITY